MDNVHKENEGLTRRQFLTYALRGTGAFMGAVILAPLVTFTVDPLRRSGSNAFVNTGKKASEFNADLPTLIQFQVKQEDAWNTHNVNIRAWVIKQGDNYLAISPKCTHLGCQVNGTTDVASGKS